MGIDSIIRYFDLASETRPTGAHAVDDSQKPAPWWPQYIALVAGIVIQPPLEHFRNSTPHQWDLSETGAWIPFALIVGIICLPAIYRNAFDPRRPMFVQLCTIFVSGLGWQALVQTAMAVAKR